MAELGLQGAALTVMSAAGPETLTAWPDQAARAQDLQFLLGEGPTAQAYRSARPVLVHDLTSPPTEWVAFAAEALDLGVGAIYAFPLQIGAVRMGVLTEYCSRGHRLDAQQVARSLQLADLVRDCLLDLLESTQPSALLDGDGDGHGHGHGHADGRPRPEPWQAEVYQAQGMLMEALGISLADALVRLRAAAFAEGLDVNTLAGDLVNGRRRLPAAGDTM